MKKILIVMPGDVEILSPLRRLVQILLHEIRIFRASVIGASSETQAMDLIHDHRIDLLLVEHTPSRINGIRFVRSIPDRSSIRRIVLVAKAPIALDEMQQMVGEGVHSVLERPLDRDELKDALRKVFAKAGPR